MSFIIGIHVTKRDLIDFANHQFDDSELCEKAINRLYEMLTLEDDDPYNISFIETFVTAISMIDKELDFEDIKMNCMDDIEDIFALESQLGRWREDDSELIFLFVMALINFLHIEKGISEIYEYTVEFITLCNNRFDITFEGTLSSKEVNNEIHRNRTLQSSVY